MNKEQLLKIQKEYQLGLHYIENTSNAKDLRPLYINKLKELKQELESLQNQEQTVHRKGK